MKDFRLALITIIVITFVSFKIGMAFHDDFWRYKTNEVAPDSRKVEIVRDLNSIKNMKYTDYVAENNITNPKNRKAYFIVKNHLKEKESRESVVKDYVKNEYVLQR